MGKIKNRVKNGLILLASATAGVIGLEVCGNGAVAAYEDGKFVVDAITTKTYTEGKIFKRTIRQNRFTGKKTQVKYDKKAGKYVPTKHQPKFKSTKSPKTTKISFKRKSA